MAEIGSIGFGTWKHAERENCIRSVVTALQAGYRHVDTAQAYHNERYVGEAVARADVPREEVFLATKVPPADLASEDVLSTTRESLDRLGVETIDLLYVHWPLGAYDPADTFSAFEKLVAEGAVRHVGVSNFTPRLIEEMRDVAGVTPFANQVELHPLLRQPELREYAQETGTYLVAYCPLARGEALAEPELRAVADEHGIGVAQVSLAWLLAKERVVPIPKATGEHIHENYRALDVELDRADVERIESIDRQVRVVDKPNAPWN
jgi:2,5-diketo-D-gluconate reductase B